MSNKFRVLSDAMKGKALPEQQDTELVNEVLSIPEIAHPTRKPRAKGKRSNPDYEQIGVYIPKKINLEVKRQLLERSGLDFSDLVTKLLEQWIQENKKSPN